MSFTKRGSIGGSGGGGSPGDPDTSVQYNKGGVFGGDADLIFDDTTGTLEPKNISISRAIDLSRKESGTANLTSSGETILAVTDTSVTRTVKIAGSDVVQGRQFIVKDEDGGAASNPITITTTTVDIDSVDFDAPSGGTLFTATTQHDFTVGQPVFQTGFSNASYNGTFIITSIFSPTAYVISAITFVSSPTLGTAQHLIDGGFLTSIMADYGAMSFYCTDLQVFAVVV